MIKVQLEGPGTGYHYHLVMTKRVLLFNCHQSVDKIYQTSCINGILCNHMKCQLPWDKIGSSNLEVCTGYNKVEQFYNAFKALTENPELEEEINKKCLKPNCETRTWTPKDWNAIKHKGNETEINFYIPAGSKVQ